jgi:hypothetical protein
MDLPPSPESLQLLTNELEYDFKCLDQPTEPVADDENGGAEPTKRAMQDTRPCY